MDFMSDDEMGKQPGRGAKRPSTVKGIVVGDLPFIRC